jgi:hypothetical protein
MTVQRQVARHDESLHTISSEELLAEPTSTPVDDEKHRGVALPAGCSGEWKLTEKKQRAEFHRLTRAGEAQLLRERSRREQSSNPIRGVLNLARIAGEI